ncbi:unnamed protein product [Rotaria magnacalcarata]|uniref:Uncharacterized protein n=5 Tax=Rotaria magnacalcarata TaxID=392030 RepID=A0A815TFE1_9BILA|nr:unnamed protein product [Rotaria magnacalcarata]CAF2106743.1 unnamed protein product [Rotaria magnacalcarata]CAF2160680.1 unnamed protein product [Rotaria magnacalcarata]CAF2176869.1 unnamed protein product [Rotaria magnacalcarata]CAF4158621.1 unnamed protein product [Rotaria magnacalcarata]
MKRHNSALTTTNESNFISLQGYVIGVTNITKNENNSNFHYKLTMEGPNGTIITVLRYLLPNGTCRLHSLLTTHHINQEGIELSCIKFIGRSYMITNDTQLIEKKLTYEPQWRTNEHIVNLKTLAEERICSVECKVLQIGEPQPYVITSGYKRIQKLRKEAIIADQTCSIALNIHDIHFNSIEVGQSYKINAIKTRLFKDMISLSTIAETTFEIMPELCNVSFDSTTLHASFKKIDGHFNHLEPDTCDTNNNTSIQSYKATIQTSPNEEYCLSVSRNLLLKCLHVQTDCSDINEINLLDLVENQKLISSRVQCTFDMNSGIINQIERQCSQPTNDSTNTALNVDTIKSPSLFTKSYLPLFNSKTTSQSNETSNSAETIIGKEPTEF